MNDGSVYTNEWPTWQLATREPLNKFVSYFGFQQENVKFFSFLTGVESMGRYFIVINSLIEIS
jgi:hypothetical protein